MHNHHDTLKRFPFGARNNPRQTWVMFLWPFIEQTTLSSKNDVNQHFYVAPCTIAGTLNGLCGARLDAYYCPSDSGSDLTNGTYQRRRGNYAVNWGPTAYDTAPASTASAPFAHINGNRSTPLKVTMASITDGTSNTLLLAEQLMTRSPDDNDWRGDIHNDDGVFKFMSITTPNSSSPDVVNWAFPNPDPDPRMPVSTSGSQYSAARSRHPGGVNAALCDGSVRFFSNTIPLNTWQWLSTSKGGEVVGDAQ